MIRAREGAVGIYSVGRYSAVIIMGGERAISIVSLRAIDSRGRDTYIARV